LWTIVIADRGGLLLLLLLGLLAAAEKQVKQTLSRTYLRRQQDRASGGGSNEQAPHLELKEQYGAKCSLQPTQRDLLWQREGRAALPPLIQQLAYITLALWRRKGKNYNGQVTFSPSRIYL
jgi:hypothetical protein